MGKLKQTRGRPRRTAARDKPIFVEASPSASSSNVAKRKWFRAAAFLLPFLFLALLEMGLRIAGWGYPQPFFLVMQEIGKKGLIENSRFAHKFFPPSVARTPQPITLPLNKPQGTLRVLVFGESAAMGDPDPSYGLARQLESMLWLQNPQRPVEVINVAMTAIDSQVMLEIARDSAKLHSDFWVVYAGNNEVIGPFGAGTIFSRYELGPGLTSTIIAMKSTRTWQLMDSLLQWGREAREWQGMEAFLGHQLRHDDRRLNYIGSRFAANLKAVIALGKQSGAQVIISTVAVNLRDSPPFASLHPQEFEASRKSAWDECWSRGAEAEKASQFEKALSEFQKAQQIDGEYAEVVFRIARCEQALGNLTNALIHYQLARDLDTLRFRADSNLNRIVRQTALAGDVPLVDAEVEANHPASEGIDGDDLFYDHVHLNFSGNLMVANLLAAEIQKLGGKTNAPAEKPEFSEQQVARHLAFTRFDQQRIAEEMRARLKQSPFKEQINSQARDLRWRDEVAKVRVSPKESVASYEEALLLNPSDWVLHANFARLLEAAGDSAKASQQWREVIRLIPHNPDAWLNLASLETDTGHYAEAENYCQEALRRYTDPVQAFNQLGLLASARGDHLLAVTRFRSAIHCRPAATVARINLAAELAQNGDFDGATNQYWEVIRRDPSNLAARNNLGSLLAKQGQSDQAWALFTKALQLEPDYPQTHYNLARLFAKRGQHEEALVHYQAAVQGLPHLAQAQLGLGLELAALGKENQALQRFAEAVNLAPNWVDAHFNYGVSLAKADRFTEAVEQFELTLKLDPSHASARQALERARELAPRKSTDR